MKKPAAFLSYASRDNKDRRLTKLRELLSHEVSVRTGEDFEIFQDRQDILWGQNWKERIEESLDEVTFLIPIITPSFFKSQNCRDELQRFLDREKGLGHNDLILPVYYVDSPLMNDSTRRTQNELAQALHAHQYADWRALRDASWSSSGVRKTLGQLAIQVRDALERVQQPKTLRSSAEAQSSEPPRREQAVGEGRSHAETLSGGIVQLPGLNSAIGRFLVTNAEYELFVREGGYAETGQQKWWSTEGREWLAAYRERRPSDYIYRMRTEDEPFDTPQHWENSRFNQNGQPVVGVSWFEAQAYCTWLSQRYTQEGITVRLPTEEEWMFAAVGSSGQPFPWGSAPPTRDVANIADKGGRPTPFDRYPSGVSWLGCHDMVGNVWEWCQDWLDSQQSHLADHPLSRAKILGGCYPDLPDRFADGIPRAYRHPGYRHAAIGFRILMEQVNTNATT